MPTPGRVSARRCYRRSLNHLLEGGKLVRSELSDLLAGVGVAVSVVEVGGRLPECLLEVGLLDAPRRASLRGLLLVLLVVIVVLLIAHEASARETIRAFDTRGELEAHVGDVALPLHVVRGGLDGEYDCVGARAERRELAFMRLSTLGENCCTSMWITSI
jgi:hypothetical protein